MPVYKKLCELLSNNHESHQLSSPPTIVSVRALWHKPTERGSSAPAKSVGRKKLPCREEYEFMVKETDHSIRHTTDQLQLASRETVRSISKGLNMHAYKVPTGQKLETFDIERHLDFSRAIHHQITATGDLGINNILFTDESAVCLGDGINRQNDRNWRIRGKHDFSETLQERRFQGPKVHV